MNCANHQQTPAAAYCRTCGKPLCTNCTRPVMGVVYCENCLAEKVAGTVPPQAAMPLGYQGPVHPVSTGPNPGLAGVLGAIPFGVGAIYNGQYTKGLVHLGIFVFLVVSLSSNLPGYMYPILGIAMAFFIAYQIVDAVRTAKAIQASQPPPDPFGLATMFSPGDKADFTRGVPTGALVLIGLGVLFLLHNLGFWFLRADVVWPIVLIAIGIWLGARRLEAGRAGNCRSRGYMGPAVLITLGVQFLLANLGVIPFDRTLPVLLIVIGVVLVIQRTSSTPYAMDTQSPSPPDAQQPPNEVNSEVKNG